MSVSNDKAKLANESELIAGKRKKANWDLKVQQRQKMQAVKQREREMQQAKSDEAERKRQVRRERVKKAEEKARLEAMASRVSAAPLQPR